MAYFPHAYKKMFLASNGFIGGASHTTTDLTAGEVGIAIANGANAHNLVQLGTNPSSEHLFYIAQGSLYASDKIGQFHGGYQETVKSKYINPKYITKAYKHEGKAPATQVIKIGDIRTANTSDVVEFAWDTNYYLRVDVKGSPVLRHLTRNGYITLQAYTECEVAGTTPSQALVAELWADYLNNDPIMSKFITAAVVYQLWDGSPDWATPTTKTLFDAEADETIKRAYLTLTASSVSDLTDQFGDSSFSPMDFVEKEFLQMYASVVDESGDPCLVDLFGESSEVTAPAQETNLGETILREMILSDSYRQEFFKVDPRMREITKNPLLGANGVDRTDRYNTYHIIHSIPRFNNPSGTFDNDQYMICIAIPDGVSTGVTDFETTLGHILSAGGNGVTLETIG